MRSVIFPLNRDQPLALRSGVDFRDPRQVDPVIVRKCPEKVGAAKSAAKAIRRAN